jgi:hypothetical protein
VIRSHSHVQHQAKQARESRAYLEHKQFGPKQAHYSLQFKLVRSWLLRGAVAEGCGSGRRTPCNAAAAAPINPSTLGTSKSSHAKHTFFSASLAANTTDSGTTVPPPVDVAAPLASSTWNMRWIVGGRAVVAPRNQSAYLCGGERRHSVGLIGNVNNRLRLAGNQLTDVMEFCSPHSPPSHLSQTRAQSKGGHRTPQPTATHAQQPRDVHLPTATHIQTRVPSVVHGAVRQRVR